MWNGQLWRGALQIVVEQDVDVYYAVGILRIAALGGASHLSLYGLCGAEQFQGGESAFYQYCGIEKVIVATKSPGL